jgi:hypothetical protein
VHRAPARTPPAAARALRRAVRARGLGLATLAACAASAAFGATAARAEPAPAPRLVVGAATTPGTCADVLRRLTGVTLPIRNVVHTEYQPFVLSKPQVEPLETQQYLQYEDPARTRPTMLMCKGKSADHVLAVHGAGSARADLATTCRDVNRDIVLGVWGTLSPAERAAARATPQRIMLEADDVKLTGSRWITPHQFAWRGSDDRPHLQARRLRADWSDWRWRLMPDSWRGTFYCQLAAPEYVRRLMLGQVELPPRAAAD